MSEIGAPLASVATMSADELQAWVRARRDDGIELFLQNGKLKFRGSKEHLTDTVMATLRAHRDAVHALLCEEFERDNRYALSFSQQAVYMLYRLVQNNPAYNTVFAAMLSDNVDVAVLCQAFEAVASQHPLFNTRFEQDASGPYQQVLAQAVQGLSIVDASAWTNAQVNAWIETESDAPFDLACESPFRATVLTSETNYLVLTVHHIGADLWSLLLIAEQLQTAYRQLRRGEPVKLPVPTGSYRQHVEFQANYLRSAQGAADWQFWRERLRDMPTLLPLPTDFARSDTPQMRGGRVSLPLSPAQSNELREFCKRQGLTPFMVVHAALQLLLHRISGQQKFIVGTPTAGRISPGCETVIGDFANPVPLCANFDAATSGAALLAHVRRQVVTALEHQAFPFPELVARLMPARDLRRSPLFQVMYVWHQAHPQSQLAATADDGDILVSQVLPCSGPRGAPYDLMLAVTDEPARLIFNWSYDVALFRERSINAIAHAHVSLLQQLLNDAAKKIAQFTLPVLPQQVTSSHRYALSHIATLWPEALLQLEGIQLVDENTLPAQPGQWCRVSVPVDSDASENVQVTQGWYQPPFLVQAPLALNSDVRNVKTAVRFDAGFGWLGGCIASLADLENAVLKIAGVRDAGVRCRWRAQGRSTTVAFVVLNKPSALASVREFLARNYASDDIHAIVLPHLPRNEAGIIDDVALGAITLFSREQQRQLSLDGERAVLLASAPHYPQAEVLYLPDFGVQATIAASDANNDNAAQITGEMPQAFADGGELIIPAQAPRTLTEAFLQTAVTSQAPLIFVDELGVESRIGYATLLQEARELAAGLQASGLTCGSRVLLQFARQREFFPMFWACVLSGIVPVSVAVPDSYDANNAVARKVANVYQSIEGCSVIAADTARTVLPTFLHDATGVAPRCLFASQLRELGAGKHADIVKPQEHDVVFLQLTSGSTGTPKAIQETHRGIIAHIHGAAQYNGYDSSDVSLNWLPTDHVVPILTTHLKDCYLGTTQIQLATRWVLQQPLRWLDAIDQYRVTHSWAPNFAYRLLNIALREALQRGEQPHWHLQQVRQFMNAGEQVTAAVICEFAQAFAPYGLNAAAMQPAFGMAECCTCITYLKNFDGKHATISTLQQPPRDFVDLGAPVPGVAIRIVDDNNRLLPEGVIGRFQMKGAVVTPGYLNNPHANAESMLDDGWFNSGDLGFIRNGHLALTGREKETIILYGNNLYCYEIEEQVGAMPGVRPTFVAAVGLRNEAIASDELILFYVPEQGFAQRESLLDAAASLAGEIAQHQGLRCRCVVPLQAHEFPKTTSGKIQRLQLKKEWQDGAFRDYLRAWDVLHRNDNTLPNWFYQPRWIDLPRRHSALSKSVALRILHDDTAQARDVIALLGEHLNVDDSFSFAHVSNGVSLAVSNVEPLVITLLLLTRDTDTAELISLLQALVKTQSAQRLLVCDTRNTQADANTAMPAIGALLQSIAAENEKLDATLLLCGNVMGNLADCIGEELAGGSSYPVVSYQHGRRRALVVEPLSLEKSTAQKTLLRDNGVYIVTGASGGIARHLIPHLLAATTAKLILISRRDIADDMRQLLVATQANSKTDSPRFVCVSADISDASALQNALSHARAALQLLDAAAIDGIFHLAGHAQFEAFDHIDVAVIDAQLAAKTRGTQALIDLLSATPSAEKPLFVVFSSVNGVFGGNQASMYSYACAQQAQLLQQAQDRVRAYTLAWSQWSGIGMSAQQNDAQRQLAERQGYLAISPTQGMASLDLVLQQPAGMYLVGLRRDCHAVQARSRDVLAAYLPCVLARGADGANLARAAQDLLLASVDETERCGLLQRRITVAAIDYPVTAALLSDTTACARLLAQVQCGEIRAATGAAYVAATTDAERRVQAIWRDVLGRDVSTRASFFEAGGDSLSAMQVASRLQAAFERTVTVADLFANTTIAQQALLLEHRMAAQIASLPAPRGGLQLLQQGDADIWVVFYPVDGALHRYTDVLAALSSHTIYGIEMGADEVELDIHTRAQRYCAQLCDVVDDASSINLLGWSLGGVIAQAVAVEMADRNKSVAQLIMLDSYLLSQLPAQYFQLAPSHMVPAFALELGVDAQFAAALVNSESVTTQLEQLQAYLQDRRGAYFSAQDVDDAFTRYRANHVALQQHMPCTYAGTARLYRAAKNPLVTLAPPDLGWQRYIAQLKVITVEADHQTIVRERDVLSDLSGVKHRL